MNFKSFLRIVLSGVLLSGCNNQPIAVQMPSAAEQASLRLIAHAEKYCRESRYEPGTAHFDDCVKNKAITDALEELALQEAASGQMAPTPVPAGTPIYVQVSPNSNCVPDVRGLSGGAALAAGFNAGMHGC